jgi:hypothetical protein
VVGDGDLLHCVGDTRKDLVRLADEKLLTESECDRTAVKERVGEVEGEGDIVTLFGLTVTA